MARNCDNNRFDGMVDHSMKNGLQMNLKDAIEDVGGKVPESACLWQYPQIIRDSLTAKAVANINLRGRDIINISTSTDNDNITTYNISTAYDTYGIDRPNYASDNSDWGDVLSADEIFNDLFKNILPNVRGVHAGDITVTNSDGTDSKEWHNTLFNLKGTKTGLHASSKYLRLYLTCQAEPVYIFIDSAVSDLTNGYNVVSSDTVEFVLDDTNMTMTAHIGCITDTQINSLK